MSRKDELKQLIKKTEKDLQKMKDELQKIVRTEGKMSKDGILVRDRGDLLFFTRNDGMTIATSSHRNEYNERDVWSVGMNWDGKSSVIKTEANILLSDERMSIKDVSNWFATSDQI